MKIGIIGLGLIGGSMGLALKNVESIQEGHISRILGYDNNPLHAQQALNLGLVDECVELNEIWQCDVIFLSVPVDGIEIGKRLILAFEGVLQRRVVLRNHIEIGARGAAQRGDAENESRYSVHSRVR